MRSCKKAIFAILSSRWLTQETLNTIMCLVESFEQVLKARPLTCASGDPDDFEALAPNQFLLGCASVSLHVCLVKPDDFNNRRVFSNPSRLVGFEYDGYKEMFHSCSDVIRGFQTLIVAFVLAPWFEL